MMATFAMALGVAWGARAQDMGSADFSWRDFAKKTEGLAQSRLHQEGVAATFHDMILVQSDTLYLGSPNMVYVENRYEDGKGSIVLQDKIGQTPFSSIDGRNEMEFMEDRSFEVIGNERLRYVHKNAPDDTVLVTQGPKGPQYHNWINWRQNSITNAVGDSAYTAIHQRTETLRDMHAAFEHNGRDVARVSLEKGDVVSASDVARTREEIEVCLSDKGLRFDPKKQAHIFK